MAKLFEELSGRNDELRPEEASSLACSLRVRLHICSVSALGPSFLPIGTKSEGTSYVVTQKSKAKPGMHLLKLGMSAPLRVAATKQLLYCTLQP